MSKSIKAQKKNEQLTFPVSRAMYYIVYLILKITTYRKYLI